MDPYIIGALIMTGGSILSSVTRKEEPRFLRPASDKFFEERVESARKIGAKRKATIALASSISGIPVEEFHIGGRRLGTAMSFTSEEAVEEKLGKEEAVRVKREKGEATVYQEEQEERGKVKELREAPFVGKAAVGKPPAKKPPSIEPLKKAVMGGEKEKKKKNIFEEKEEV